MLENLFGVTEQAGGVSVTDTLARMLASVIIGIIIAAVYILITEKSRRSVSFIVSMLMLPAVVVLVIILVGSNVARAFSIAGVFSLVRFRSAPGESKDISLVFMAMAAGLACGLGYITLGFCVLFILGLIVVLGFKVAAVCFKDTSRQLRILIPEDMNYVGAFDDLFRDYTREAKLECVKTTNMGTLFELTYQVQMKRDSDEKKFLDEIRCRNGNLKIIFSSKEKNTEKL
ncbi:MAG: DUF4956 domain-containing protein [Lachnospiraceae bacterium]|nr:DUF4956 domain-containing protein [Lachnospiraceae bacterium]